MVTRTSYSGYSCFTRSGEPHGSPRHFAFGHEYDAAAFALAETVLNEFGQLVYLGGDFRYDGRLRTGGYRAVEGKEPGIASHHFDEEEPFVRHGRVAYLVHRLHDGVQGRVITYRRIRAGEVVVYRSGKAHNREVEFGRELPRPGQRTVAAYHHERVDVFALHVLERLPASFEGLKLLAPGRFQDGSAELDDVAYVFRAERFNLSVQESPVSVVDALDLEAVVQGGTGHRTDGGIHAGGIAAGCQYAYAVNTEHIVCFLIEYRSLRDSIIVQMKVRFPFCRSYGMQTTVQNYHKIHE